MSQFDYRFNFLFFSKFPSNFHTLFKQDLKGSAKGIDQQTATP